MADIQTALTDRKRMLADAERLALQLRDEISALQKAMEILGLTAVDNEVADEIDEFTPSRRGGKPQGAISQTWRTVLGYLAINGKSHTLADVKAAADLHGAGGEMSSIRDRMRRFTATGLVHRNPDETYSVTPMAIEKFNLLSDQQTRTAPSEEEAVHILDR